VHVRVVARDAHGNAVAQTVVTGTPYTEKGQKVPALPFVVALPDKRTIASVEILPAHGNRPLARLKRSTHAPTGRLLGLPRRVSASKLLVVTWRAADRDRGDRLSVVLLARRGHGGWRTIVMGPANGSFGLAPNTLGRRGEVTLRLQVSDGFNTTAGQLPSHRGALTSPTAEVQASK
jgi:hypothetical protein